MRTIIPQPGYTAEQVHQVMQSRQFVYADCFTIVPKQGDPMRYTTFQRHVSVVGILEESRVTYLGNRVLIKGLRVKASVGVEVDEQELSVDFTDQPQYQNDLTWSRALLLGRLDGAKIRRDRFIQDHDGKWCGGFRMFSGLVSTLRDVGRQSATINVKSDLVLLNVQSPRDLWEANCKNTLGDPLCGIDLPSLRVVATTGANPTRSFLPWTGASDDYALGKIHVGIGDDTTRIRTVSRVANGGLYLSYPLDFDPYEGMLFDAYPGCNRTKERCPRFHGSTEWVKRFKGFPYIPVAETAV